MTTHILAASRMVLRDMGKAGLVIMVLASAASGSEDSDTTATPSSGWRRANLGFVSAYILYRDGEAALIDTGVPGSEVAIRAALGELGMNWDSVSHVIITHRHDDHQGSLDGVIYRTDAPWYAGAGDMTAIDGPAEGIIVGNGDSVFDLEIIETPGHTPGHVSVLDRAAKVLVSGDAINGADGGVIGANPEFTEDMTVANASIGKLAEFDFDVVLFGHGEPVESGAGDAVRSLAATLS